MTAQRTLVVIVEDASGAPVDDLKVKAVPYGSGLPTSIQVATDLESVIYDTPIEGITALETVGGEQVAVARLPLTRSGDTLTAMRFKIDLGEHGHVVDVRMPDADPNDPDVLVPVEINLAELLQGAPVPAGITGVLNLWAFVGGPDVPLSAIDIIRVTPTEIAAGTEITPRLWAPVDVAAAAAAHSAAAALPAGGDTGEVLTKTSDVDGEADWEAAGAASVKPFARAGSTDIPLPADLAPNPQSGRVLGMITQGGVLGLRWNQLAAGSPHLALNTIPDAQQIAIGGLVPQGGVVLVRETSNHASQLWVRISPAFPLTLFHTFADPLVEPDPLTGKLPDPTNFPGRLAIAGNHFYRAENQGGSDKTVTFKDYGPTRTVAAGEPIKLPEELLYAGSVANPPAGSYVLDATAWDRGSQIWIINETAGTNDWADWGGPVHFWHGHLYISDAEAAKHITSASDEGRVLIIGHGSGQKARIITAFAAATDDDWQWLPIGVDLGDIVTVATTQIAAHNADADAHPAIRALIAASGGGITAIAAAALIEAHNTAGDAHADIRQLITQITQSQAGKVTISAYSATATYALGSANSIITHGGKLLIYISATPRSSAHDPGVHPNYWFTADSHVHNLDNATSRRFNQGDVIILTSDDSVYLAATAITTARGADWIRSHAGPGGEFILLTSALSLPLALNDQEAFRQFALAGSGTQWKEGQLARGIESPHSSWFLVNSDHQQAITDDPNDEDDFSRIGFTKQLTQAQYDALSSGAKNPNVLYLIVG